MADNSWLGYCLFVLASVGLFATGSVPLYRYCLAVLVVFAAYLTTCRVMRQVFAAGESEDG
ncbi:hypothetical protein [Endozoicomonas lisbonensis]|uniref:YiaAB two helix domain-containing protein n=2 Tax=Endozoicomonas lisbonensis TaxID=3120522 RepID=A0ABV2SP39_9GAMM